MFDALSDKLQATLSDLRSHGTLTEDDINRAMRENWHDYAVVFRRRRTSTSFHSIPHRAGRPRELHR